MVASDRPGQFSNVVAPLALGVSLLTFVGGFAPIVLAGVLLRRDLWSPIQDVAWAFMSVFCVGTLLGTGLSIPLTIRNRMTGSRRLVPSFLWIVAAHVVFIVWSAGLVLALRTL